MQKQPFWSVVNSVSLIAFCRKFLAELLDYENPSIFGTSQQMWTSQNKFRCVSCFWPVDDLRCTHVSRLIMRISIGSRQVVGKLFICLWHNNDYNKSNCRLPLLCTKTPESISLRLIKFQLWCSRDVLSNLILITTLGFSVMDRVVCLCTYFDDSQQKFCSYKN